MCHLPKLPQHKELVSRLAPIHARLSRSSSIAKRHPVYKFNEAQVFVDFILKDLVVLLASFLVESSNIILVEA